MSNSEKLFRTFCKNVEDAKLIKKEVICAYCLEDLLALPEDNLEVLVKLDFTDKVWGYVDNIQDFILSLESLGFLTFTPYIRNVDDGNLALIVDWKIAIYKQEIGEQLCFVCGELGYDPIYQGKRFKSESISCETVWDGLLSVVDFCPALLKRSNYIVVYTFMREFCKTLSLSFTLDYNKVFDDLNGRNFTNLDGYV